MKKIFKLMLIIICVVLLLIFAALTYLLILTKDAKLSTEKLSLNYGAVTFLDIDGNSLEFYPTGVKKAVEIEKISKQTKNAFIAIEDKRFNKHGGLDYKRMTKATLNNLSSFAYKEGASTISQQLIKNTHLTNSKNIKRKATEIKLTLDLEKKYSKEQILELYLNSIYFGENAFGITAASKVYFDKKPSELSLSESAMLAAIIKAPSKYSPYVNSEKCKARRNLVLKTMLKQNYITETEFLDAIKVDLPINKNVAEVEPYLARAFNELLEVTKLSPYELLNCKVETYLNKDLQNYLLNLKIEEIESYGRSSVIIDNETGGILAYNSNAGNCLRLPGSVIKPLLVYAPAIENNIVSPASIIDDSPTDFNGYSPKNFGGKYNGNVSVRFALKNSLNIPAVKILSYTGIEKSKEIMKKLNIELDKNDNSLATALGGLTFGLNFVDLVSAYNCFANGGTHNNGVFIKQVTNNKKEIIYTHKPTKKDVLSESTAFLINDMLKDAVKDGTAKNLKYFDFDLAAKSGTAGNENGNTDAYMIAYTSKHTVGFWTGALDMACPMDNSITGGTYPAVGVRAIIEKLYKDEKPICFKNCDSVKSVELDKISYTEENLIELADTISPPNYKISEYFKIEQLPKRQSTRFSLPYIQEANISIDNNKVSILLCLAEYYEYGVFREIDGKKECIYDSLSNNRVLTINDSPKESGLYKYSIIPYYKKNDTEIYYGAEVFLPEVKYTKQKDKPKLDEKDERIIEKDEWWKD